MFSESNSSRSGLQKYAAHTRTKTGRVLQNRQLRIVEVGSSPSGSASDSAMSFSSSRLRPVPQTFRGKQVTPSTDVYLGKHDDESYSVSGTRTSVSINSGRPDPTRCYYDNAESFYTQAGQRSPSSSGEEAIMWRTYPAKAYIPRDKTGKNASRQSLEESTLVDFVSLAHDDVIPRAQKESASNDSVTDSLVNHQLYELGILYDDVPSHTNIDDDETSPYQAAGLGFIQHSEPLYTVRYITAKSRRGLHSRSVATPPLQQ